MLIDQECQKLPVSMTIFNCQTQFLQKPLASFFQDSKRNSPPTKEQSSLKRMVFFPSLSNLIDQERTNSLTISFTIFVPQTQHSPKLRPRFVSSKNRSIVINLYNTSNWTCLSAMDFSGTKIAEKLRQKKMFFNFEFISFRTC